MIRALLIAGLPLLLFGIAGRLIPHLPNATPLAAIALAGGIYLGQRWAIFLPLLALAITDLVLGIYDWRIMMSVYLSFTLIGILANELVRFKKTTAGITMIVVSPLLFFFTTNFAVWFFSPWYEKSVAGLLYAYELGLPFLRNMFLGDVTYIPLVLGICVLAEKTPSVIRALRTTRKQSFR